jgi:hypothetical protein
VLIRLLVNPQSAIALSARTVASYSLRPENGAPSCGFIAGSFLKIDPLDAPNPTGSVTEMIASYSVG